MYWRWLFNQRYWSSLLIYDDLNDFLNDFKITFTLKPIFKKISQYSRPFNVKNWKVVLRFFYFKSFLQFLASEKNSRSPWILRNFLQALLQSRFLVKRYGFYRVFHCICLGFAKKIVKVKTKRHITWILVFTSWN